MVGFGGFFGLIGLVEIMVIGSFVWMMLIGYIYCSDVGFLFGDLFY